MPEARVPTGTSLLPVQDGSDAGGGQELALAQVFGWLGSVGAAGGRLGRGVPWRDRSARLGTRAAPGSTPAHRRGLLAAPFLLLHPGLVPAGFVGPTLAGIAGAAYRLASDPAASAAVAAGGDAVPTGAQHALAEAEREIAALRGALDRRDPDWDARGAASWREGLRQEADRLRQRREAARATLAAAQRLMSDQPGSVLALRETTAQQTGYEARATLLRLQLEREHLAAQYVPGYPALREIDRQIAVVKAGLEEGRRPNVSRTREVRNPALDALGQRAALAQVDLAATEAQLAEVDRQLAQAEARRAELADATGRLEELERRRGALQIEAGASRRPAVSAAMSAPATDAVPWARVVSPLLAGLAGGGLLAAALRLLQRRSLAAAAVPSAMPLPPTEILPPPAWPFAAESAAAPEAIWSKPGVGSSAQEAVPRLRAPVGTGCRWD